MHSLKIRSFSCLKAEVKPAELKCPECNRAVHPLCPLRSQGLSPLLQKPELGIHIPIYAPIWCSKFKSDTSQAAAHNLFSADTFSKPGGKKTRLLHFRLRNATAPFPLPMPGNAGVPCSYGTQEDKHPTK